VTTRVNFSFTFCSDPYVQASIGTTLGSVRLLGTNSLTGRGPTGFRGGGGGGGRGNGNGGSGGGGVGGGVGSCRGSISRPSSWGSGSGSAHVLLIDSSARKKMKILRIRQGDWVNMFVWMVLVQD
jgi:hypothetical protein